MGDKDVPAAPNQLLMAVWLRSCSHHVCSDDILRTLWHARAPVHRWQALQHDGLVTGRPKQHVADARPRDWMDLLHPTAKRLESKKIGTAYNWGAV